METWPRIWRSESRITSRALDTQVDENLEGVRPRDNQATVQQTQETSDGEGMLSEWLQKTETGRDFYSKESFTGFWMPFGFKAEVVTITERLLCSPNDKPSGKAITPAGVLPDGTQPSPDELVVDLRDDEAQLTAQLVARKFGRIRGSRTRVFSDTESADFAQIVDQNGNPQPEGEAGRCIGLQKVEVLVERTPVLANQQTQSAIFVQIFGSGLRAVTLDRSARQIRCTPGGRRSKRKRTAIAQTEERSRPRTYAAISTVKFYGAFSSGGRGYDTGPSIKTSCSCAPDFYGAAET
jgi:hypothetical protein